MLEKVRDISGFETERRKSESVKRQGHLEVKIV